MNEKKKHLLQDQKSSITRADAREERQIRGFKKKDEKISDHMQIVSAGVNNTVVEFIGTDDFSAQWYQRQRFEVDAGRESEPTLYEPLYNEVSDPSLPRYVSVYKTGPGGVVFDEVTEGGEVKMAQVNSSNYPVPIKHYAVGLEYTKDLLIYNELWNIAIIERQAGVAFNALKNDCYLSPFITNSYVTRNQTAASAVGITLAEKYLRTLELAVTHAVADTTSPRRGPYAILCSTADLFTLERALMRGVPQQGFSVTSSILGRINNIIAYDGWSGTRGKIIKSYAGVTAGKCYLINLGYKEIDHQSYEKQPLQASTGESDMSRFILEQTLWDTYFGMYCNPGASTEEVTLPTS